MLEETETLAVAPNKFLKNDFFQKVFEDKERLVELVQFFSESKVARETEISNVQPVLVGERYNDLSFLADESLYYFLEANATPNPNMPFRILQYVAAALQAYADKNALYGKNLVKIKVPKLYTLFTGCVAKEPKAVIATQRLSQMYEVKQDSPDLEVVVHTYDFNMTMNEIQSYLQAESIPARLMKFKDATLFHYALFANCVVYRYRKIGQVPNKARLQAKAVTELCHLFSQRGIFIELFQDKKVINMAIMQFSRLDEVAYVSYEEGRMDSIKSTIRILANLNTPKEIVTKQLQQEFKLSAEKAAGYVEQFYLS